MNLKVGKYEVTYGVDEVAKSTTISVIYDSKNKKKYNGYLYITTRKAFNKFKDDLAKDILPPSFVLWVKPEDVMSEAEIKSVMEWRATK